MTPLLRAASSPKPQGRRKRAYLENRGRCAALQIPGLLVINPRWPDGTEADRTELHPDVSAEGHPPVSAMVIPLSIYLPLSSSSTSNSTQMKGIYRTITFWRLRLFAGKKTEPKTPSRCEWGYGGSFDKNRHLKYSVVGPKYIFGEKKHADVGWPSPSPPPPPLLPLRWRPVDLDVRPD
jgi:hypothetical protein